MNVEKIFNETIISAKFHDLHKELVDVDFLFKDTNKFFGRWFIERNMVPTFDFTNHYNKRLYTNEFIKTFCEYLKSREDPYTLYFYSNLTTKDKFRNGLITKIKKIFGFKIWEDQIDLDTLVNKFLEGDCGIVTGLEVFFDGEKTVKNFKTIKKHLEKNGMHFLNDVYFQDLSNKMLIFC